MCAQAPVHHVCMGRGVLSWIELCVRRVADTLRNTTLCTVCALPGLLQASTWRRRSAPARLRTCRMTTRCVQAYVCHDNFFTCCDQATGPDSCIYLEPHNQIHGLMAGF